MVLNVHRNRKAYWGRGEGGEGGGKRESIYLSLHCHHQNDSSIKMGSDESHFNVSVGSDGHSHKTVSTNHNLFEEKGELKRYRTEVLPLTARPNRLTTSPWNARFLQLLLVLGKYSYASIPDDAFPLLPANRVHQSIAHARRFKRKGSAYKIIRKVKNVTHQYIFIVHFDPTQYRKQNFA